MKFIIKNKAEEREVYDGYLLVIDTMIGDADGDEKVKVGVFHEEELHLLEEVIHTCDNMLKAYPDGRCGDDDYNNIAGFDKWFTEDGEDEDIEHIAPFDWAYSKDGYYTQNSITGYNVYCFKNGKKYEVEISE